MRCYVARFVISWRGQSNAPGATVAPSRRFCFPTSPISCCQAQTAGVLGIVPRALPLRTRLDNQYWLSNSQCSALGWRRLHAKPQSADSSLFCSNVLVSVAALCALRRFFCYVSLLFLLQVQFSLSPVVGGWGSQHRTGAIDLFTLADRRLTLALGLIPLNINIGEASVQGN